MAGDTEARFEAARQERDPLQKARLATELLTTYQQRMIELARLRREAIDELQADRGMSYAAVAAELGLSKGRIGQIKQTSPPRQRAFFGVGPITVAVPLRYVPDRALPMLASEDAAAAERITSLLTDLAFQTSQLRIPPDGLWSPAGDVVAICGPRSSRVVADALERDPFLAFREIDGRWAIRDRTSDDVFTSPLDDESPAHADVAYIGRLRITEGTMLVVAGVHALGSLGAVHYLTEHLHELYDEVRTERFSMVVRSMHDGDKVTRSELACPPRRHP